MRMTRSLTRVMALPPLVGPGPGRSLRGSRTIATCGEVELSPAPLEGHAGERTLFSPGFQSVAEHTHMSSPRGRDLRMRGIEPDTL